MFCLLDDLPIFLRGVLHARFFRNFDVENKNQETFGLLHSVWRIAFYEKRHPVYLGKTAFCLFSLNKSILRGVLTARIFRYFDVDYIIIVHFPFFSSI